VIRRTSIAFVGTIAAQLAALPESAFETELPEMDVLYLDEIEALRCNLSAVLAEWTTGEQVGIREAWRKLRAIAKDQYRWKIKDLSYQMSLGEDEEDEDEEGEYAPVVVEA